MKVLSFKQPWAWLLVNGFKDVENRNWRTHYRGKVLIHASKQPDLSCFYPDGSLILGKHPYPASIPAHLEAFQYGGIIGEVTITDCVDESNSPWFWGRYGFVIGEARPLPFAPLRGQLGLFEVELDYKNLAPLPD